MLPEKQKILVLTDLHATVMQTDFAAELNLTIVRHIAEAVAM